MLDMWRYDHILRQVLEGEYLASESIHLFVGEYSTWCKILLRRLGESGPAGGSSSRIRIGRRST